MGPLLTIGSAATRRNDLFPVDLEARSQTSLALMGQWHALFQVLTGELALPTNAIRIRGVDARAQVISGKIGVLPSRFDWPQNQSVCSVLELSAGLLGMSAGETKQEVERLLAQLELTPVRRQSLSNLRPLQMRLLGLAHALLGSPDCLALEDVLLGLTTRDSLLFLTALGTARQGRSLIVNVTHAAPGSVERLLLDGCEEVLVLEHGAITLQGSPSQLEASTGLLQITIAGPGAAQDGHTVCAALRAQGIVVRSCTAVPSSSTGPTTPGTTTPEALAAAPMARLVVELDPGSPTLPLFAAAKSCDSTLLDLHALPNLE